MFSRKFERDLVSKHNLPQEWDQISTKFFGQGAMANVTTTYDYFLASKFLLPVWMKFDVKA